MLVSEGPFQTYAAFSYLLHDSAVQCHQPCNNKNNVLLTSNNQHSTAVTVFNVFFTRATGTGLQL